jgi:hypothetical protein
MEFPPFFIWYLRKFFPMENALLFKYKQLEKYSADQKPNKRYAGIILNQHIHNSYQDPQKKIICAISGFYNNL